jgi:hypothetical protein
MQMTSRGVAAIAACLALAVAVLEAPALADAAGTSIATAPPMTFGTLQTGGGNYQDFWRFQGYGGDRITIRADLPPTTYEQQLDFSIFSPKIDDYTYDQTADVAAYGTYAGAQKQQFTLAVPFTGQGTLVVCEGEYHSANCANPNFPADTMDSYSFTPTVVHAVSLSLSGPTLARRRSQIRLVARVTSPAGVPSGHCIFTGSVPVTAVAGKCTNKLRAANGRSQRVGVQFIPDDGWSGATRRRTIRLY